MFSWSAQFVVIGRRALVFTLFLSGVAVAETVTLCGGSGAMFGENESLLETLHQPDLGDVVTTQVAVDLVLEHDWVGDLWVILKHGETDVELLQLPGSPASPYGCGGDDVSVTLMDDAPLPVEDACLMTPPAIAGVFAPNGFLGDFRGANPAGAWTVAIFDLGVDDCGVLPMDGVCVHVTYAPDCNVNGIADHEDIASGESADENGNLIPDECEVRGDCDADGDVDLWDHACFEACRIASGVPAGCESVDFDGDADVDIRDWGELQIAFSR